MLAQVEHVDRRGVAGGLRQHDLSAVGGRGHARAQMHVLTHVALAGGVQPHAHAEGTRGESLLSTPSGVERLLGGWEGDEEGVTLRVHLHATMVGEGLPQQPPVLGQSLGVALGPQFVQQPGGALDVGEEEGDGP